MAKPKVQVVGQRELDKALADVDADCRELGKPARAGATLIARTAASYGPNRSGDLAGSYRALGGKRSARVVSNSIYSAVIEFGWAKRGIDPQRRIYRAIDATARQVQALFEEHVRGVIRDR